MVPLIQPELVVLLTTQGLLLSMDTLFLIAFFQALKTGGGSRRRGPWKRILLAVSFITTIIVFVARRATPMI